MGYFANGTEGERYYQRWCARCANRPHADDECCPIWLVHLVHSYAANGDAREILNALIPPGDAVTRENGQCTMFVEELQERLPL